jgi:uncharacterized protein YfaS (alpha-2-macroglobulin family)
MPTTIVLSQAALTGDSVRFLATIRDFSGNLTDPVSTGCAITNIDGSVTVATLAPVRDSAGQWHADWQVPSNQALGDYVVDFFGTLGTQTHHARARFKVQYA